MWQSVRWQLLLFYYQLFVRVLMFLASFTLAESVFAQQHFPWSLLNPSYHSVTRDTPNVDPQCTPALLDLFVYCCMWPNKLNKCTIFYEMTKKAITRLLKTIQCLQQEVILVLVHCAYSINNNNNNNTMLFTILIILTNSFNFHICTTIKPSKSPQRTTLNHKCRLQQEHSMNTNSMCTALHSTEIPWINFKSY